MSKPKKQYPQDFKTLFGVSTMGWTSMGSASFMTSLFMLFLTDYAGIGAYAATLGTVLLFAGRIFDAVNDPLQGWIMDNAKRSRWGQYKPFVFLSIVLTTVAILALYLLPRAIAQNPVLVTIWIVFFYLLYDIGASFYAEGPLKQTMTLDETVRAKLNVIPRVISTFVAIPFAFFLAMTTALNRSVGDMNKSFAMMTAFIMIPVGLLSLLGISLVREGKYNVKKESDEKIGFKDIIGMFKGNKPLWIHFLAQLFCGFNWTMIFATTTYYMKWAYCADPVTGVVDSAKLGTYTAILGTMQILPMIIGTAIGPMLMRRLKSTIKFAKISLMVGIVSGFLMFICKITGLLNAAPLYFILLFVQLLSVGLAFTPFSLLWMECMDYNAYKRGNSMSGIVNATQTFLGKAQTALSSALVGIILIAIGYRVDSVTDAFIGDLSKIPTMTTWFVVVSGLVPAVLSILAYLLYKFSYPITDDVRIDMKEVLNERIETVE